MSATDHFQELADALKQLLHFLITLLHLFFSSCSRQSHGQTSALLWLSRGLWWLPAPVFSSDRHAATRFVTDSSKIAFITCSLTGQPLQWAQTFWDQAGPLTQSFDGFLSHFQEVFSCPAGDSSVSEQLYHLRQGKM